MGTCHRSVTCAMECVRPTTCLEAVAMGTRETGGGNVLRPHSVMVAGGNRGSMPLHSSCASFDGEVRLFLNFIQKVGGKACMFFHVGTFKDDECL